LSCQKKSKKNRKGRIVRYPEGFRLKDVLEGVRPKRAGGVVKKSHGERGDTSKERRQCRNVGGEKRKEG